MPIIAAIDPGLCAGIAIHDTERKTWTVGILDDSWYSRLVFASMVFIEKPVIYPHTKARPNDLITLALKAGEAAGHCIGMGKPVRYVTPQEWKKQVPKTICHARMANLMTDAEKAQIANLDTLPDSKRHNALDAVGIALFACGRKI